MTPAGGRIGGSVEVQTGNGLTRYALLLDQMAQGILHTDMQAVRKLFSEQALRRTIDEVLRGCQHGAVQREPDRAVGPQAVGVKAGDFAQCVVATTRE